MRTAIFAGAACALSLFTPAFSATRAGHIRSGALAVEQLGDKGPPLIFIPGLASGSWTWRDSAERLWKSHAVYLVTLPGFDGRKPVPGTTLETRWQGSAHAHRDPQARAAGAHRPQPGRHAGHGRSPPIIPIASPVSWRSMACRFFREPSA